MLRSCIPCRSHSRRNAGGETHGSALRLWVDAIGQMEALLSLATYSFEHPADPFPEFADGAASFDGEELGHPLVPAALCVRNDVSITRGDAGAAGQRLQHVGQEHAAAGGRDECGAGHGGRAGASAALAAYVRCRWAPAFASMIRCRKVVRGSMRRSHGCGRSSIWRAAIRRCCFCSMSCCKVRTRTIAALARKESCARW